MMSSHSAQLEEVRKRAESHLSLSGSAQEVKADVHVMAHIPLSPSEKYRHITAETMVRDNAAEGHSRHEVSSSLHPSGTFHVTLHTLPCRRIPHILWLPAAPDIHYFLMFKCSKSNGVSYRTQQGIILLHILKQ